MKVFFDTNVYIAEALLGSGAKRLIRATQRARWRVYSNEYILSEVVHVLIDDLAFSPRLAAQVKRMIVKRGVLVQRRVAAEVPADPKDSPVLQGALACSADYLVTNDKHLLSLNPFESLRIISMQDYLEVLRQNGHLQ